MVGSCVRTLPGLRTSGRFFLGGVGDACLIVYHANNTEIHSHSATCWLLLSSFGEAVDAAKKRAKHRCQHELTRHAGSAGP